MEVTVTLEQGILMESPDFRVIYSGREPHFLDSMPFLLDFSTLFFFLFHLGGSVSFLLESSLKLRPYTPEGVDFENLHVRKCLFMCHSLWVGSLGTVAANTMHL